MFSEWANALMVPLMLLCAYDAWGMGWWPVTVWFVFMAALNAVAFAARRAAK